MNEEINIFKVLDFIRDNSAAYAQAKANRQYLENYRKTVKAQQMKQHLSLPVSAQEREAYASEEMQQIDKAIQTAQEEEVQRAQAFQTYVNALAGHPKALSIAAQIVGVDLPAGMEYDELDTKPEVIEPEPAPMVEEVEEEVEEDETYETLEEKYAD
jgi:hypothetical protein